MTKQKTKVRRARSSNGQSTPGALALELGIKERFTVLNLLPKTGSIHEAVQQHNIRAVVKVSDEEAEGVSLKQTATGISWNALAEVPKRCEFSAEAVQVFLDGCELLSSEKKFPTDGDTLALYQRFASLEL